MKITIDTDTISLETLREIRAALGKELVNCDPRHKKYATEPELVRTSLRKKEGYLMTLTLEVDRVLAHQH